MFIKRHFNAIIRCIALVFLVLVQLAIISGLSAWLHHNTVYTYIMIEVIGMLSMLPLLADSRNSAYKIYWILIILIIPIGGHIIYALWGEEGIHHKQHSKIKNKIAHANEHQEVDTQILKQIEDIPVSRYLARQNYPAYQNTKMNYFGNPKEGFSSILKDCQNAKKFIFISFFRMEDGTLLEELKSVLIERARQGVEIRLMYDDAGSILKLSDHSLDELIACENVKLRRFNSLEKNINRQYFQYRNHQKLVIIDGDIGYTGSMYLSDHYVNRCDCKENSKGSFIRLVGDGVWSLSLIFLGTWGDECEQYAKYHPEISVEGGICQPYADGPANNEDNVAKDVYFLMAANSRNILYVMTPFLILDDELSEALCLTAKAGVDVRIITNRRSKHKMRKLLTELNYGPLLKAGARVYEYEPGYIYAKVCVNDTSCKIGTVNMDFRSFYLHYECGTMLYDESLRKDVYNDYMETLKKCREITWKEWKGRPWYIKIAQMFLKIVQCQF